MKAFGTCGNNFRDVKAMHIDNRGNLYVCESRNNRVCVFSVIKSQEKLYSCCKFTDIYHFLYACYKL